MEKPTTPANIPLYSVPDSLLEVVDGVARAHLRGDDAVLDALATQVRELSRLYTRDRSAIGSDDQTRLLAARLRFFLPRDLPKVILPLRGLELSGALPRTERWSVLDVGAGLGATSLGVARFARLSGRAKGIDVTAIDPFERGLSIFVALAKQAERAGLCHMTVRTITSDMSGRLPAGPYDLIVFGLSLNEWARDRTPEDAAALLARAGERLSPNGALVVLEPALKSEARFLQRTRDVLDARDEGLTVFAPCVSPGPCPMLSSERDWCHAEAPGDLPRSLATIARTAGLRRSRRTFAYLTIRRGRRPEVAEPNVYRVVSQGLASKGKLELFVCGGGELVRLTRLNRHTSDANAELAAAQRGDLLVLGDVAIDAKKGRVGEASVVRRQGIGLATEPPN